ncbi:TIGR03560 family F420-dependent LLM class oxidoreductase [Actinoplanes sp. NPDC051859]|uniref:TIGR03560 family F420-dependent LLM class oxidoreductase n=1 Tax=Actinoplanes sp. NPDC051859 TaxID=3363909 RepID=UPI0037BB5507
MEVRIHVEPTEAGARYAALSRAAQVAEDCGFDGFFRSDHYLRFGTGHAGPPGPSDAWTTLAGLARDTRRIRLGTLVSPVTFRSPGQLAVQVADVDDMSGGRVELGLGAGWYAAEHAAYGIDFPTDRFTRLTEQLAIVTGLWHSTGPFSYAGKHHHLTDAIPPRREPGRPAPPLIIGGLGARRTPALAARYATEYNALGAAPAEATERYALVSRLAVEAGRPTGAVTCSALQTLACGRTDAEVARRVAAAAAPPGPDAFTGSPDAVVDRIARYAEAGATRVYLSLADLDLDQLELVASTVLPQLALRDG